MSEKQVEGCERGKSSALKQFSVETNFKAVQYYTNEISQKIHSSRKV